MSQTHYKKNQFQQKLQNYENRINLQRKEELQQQFQSDNNSFFGDLFVKNQRNTRHDGSQMGRLTEGESRYAAIDIEQIYRMQAMKQDQLEKKIRDLKQNPQKTIKYMPTKETKGDEQDKSSQDLNSSIQDSDLSNFYSNTPLSIDGQLSFVAQLTFSQICSMLCFKFSIIINAFFVSLAGYYNIDTKENTTALIKGIGLGNIIISILCLGISQGLNGALETLVSQAYGASKNLKESEYFRDEMRRLCGQYLNMARLVNTLFMIFPTAILALFADEILITFFKQNAYVSEIAIQYCIICMPGVWAMTQFDASKRFLSAQNHGGIPMITQLITCVIQIFFCYVLMIKFQWGLLGAAISTNITYILNMVICDFWIALHSEGHYKNMWVPWSRTSIEGLGQFLEYGIPSAIMESVLWVALELFVFVTGYAYGRKSQNQFSLSEREDFSAQVVIMNIFGLIYMIPQGISYTISALVGSLQAENKTSTAKKYACVAYFYGQFQIILVIIVLHLYGHKIFRHFVNNEETTSRILTTLPFIFVFMFLQSSIGLLTGIIKGLGQQSIAAFWTFIGYFVVGLPLASFFAFRAQAFFQWQTKPYLNQIHNLTGLYVGFIIACVILNLSFYYIINKVDWHAHAKRINQDFEYYKHSHISYFNHQSYEKMLSSEAMYTRQSISISGQPALFGQEQPLPSDINSDNENKITFMQSEQCSVQDFTKEQQQILKQQLNEKDDEYQCLFEEEINYENIQKDDQNYFDQKIQQAEQRRVKNLRKYI